ncbi:hypothetical protein [Trichocoleus sp. FACHB-591]|nr:hypothetical protein [Trichocoleus sp. FACHB-591]
MDFSPIEPIAFAIARRPFSQSYTESIPLILYGWLCLQSVWSQ